MGERAIVCGRPGSEPRGDVIGHLQSAYERGCGFRARASQLFGLLLEMSDRFHGRLGPFGRDSLNGSCLLLKCFLPRH